MKKLSLLKVYKEALEEGYKYNTVEEFMNQYAMDGEYRPDEVAPHVREFLSKYNFDIPTILSIMRKYHGNLGEAQDPETDKGGDPQLWLQDPDPEHDVELVKVAVPKGWNRGNKTRSTQAVGKHAGRMNRRDVMPDIQKDLGMGDGNERSDKQKD